MEAKLSPVRDLVVREALEQLAADASIALSEVVGAGHEVPFEVEEQVGAGPVLYHYTPLIDRFLREHARVLRGLDGYGSARAAVESAGFAEDYLRYVGGVIPSDPEAQAGETIFVFLCRLWRDCPTFELEDGRIEAALRELENSYDGRADTVEVVVPLVGLTMPVEKLRLGDVSLVQADTVDVPPEVLRADGEALRQPVLGVARVAVHGEASPAATGIERLRLAVASLRLLGEGSVGLGPHAWTRAGDGQWRRISSGAAPVRTAGYALSEEDCGELSLFVDSLRMRPIRTGELSFAIRRFEGGLERPSALEGLSDYLLALRAMLEGGGPADLGLSLRVAALCAEPAERAGVKRLVDGAFALEREVMLEDGVLDDPEAALVTVRDVEDLTRAILRDAVGGHLGLDLRATADEILLADGLDIGPPEPATASESAERLNPPDPPTGTSHLDRDGRDGSHSPGRDLVDRAAEDDEMHMHRVPRPPTDSRNVPPGAGEDWFAADEDEEEPRTMEWPTLTKREPRERKPGSGSAPQRSHLDNVRNLFPEPDTTEWSITGKPRRLPPAPPDEHVEEAPSGMHPLATIEPPEFQTSFEDVTGYGREAEARAPEPDGGWDDDADCWSAPV